MRPGRQHLLATIYFSSGCNAAGVVSIVNRVDVKICKPDYLFAVF
jgi:hypothetical protein